MNRELNRTFRLKSLRQSGQFIILLIAMLGFLLIPPFFIQYESAGVLASTFLSVMLLSALYVFPRRRTFVAACGLAVPALVGRWVWFSPFCTGLSHCCIPVHSSSRERRSNPS
jgi:hypothetical protein